MRRVLLLLIASVLSWEGDPFGEVSRQESVKNEEKMSKNTEETVETINSCSD